MSPQNSISPRTIRFMSVSSPKTRKHTPADRSAIQSHAARTTHARVRRARTLGYQAANAAMTTTTTTTTQDLLPCPAKGHLGTELSRTVPATHDVAQQQSEVVIETQRHVAGWRPVLGGLGSGRRDLFTSFVRPFAPIEHFLLDHYLTTVSPYLKSQCIKTDAYRPSLDGMIQGWVRLGLSDYGFLSGIFLNASRHLSGLSQQHQGARFSQLATWYKLPCVRAVNDAINLRSEGMLFSDSIIAQVMILALDEITSGDMAMARNHVRGAASMVVLNGGPQTLGLDGFLEIVLEKYGDQVGVRLDRGASHGGGIPFEDDVRS